MHGSRTLDDTIGSELKGRILEARVELHLRAEQYQADALYRDAEYLYRRATFDINLHHDDLQHVWSEGCDSHLISIYEKLGDWTAAEIAQEQLLISLKAKGANEQKLVQEAENLDSILGFWERWRREIPIFML